MELSIAQIIKYEGDNSTFVWKHPSEDFNTSTQLIVHESQEAIFFMNGQALDLFGAGRYTLETENIPLIRKVTNLPTGGQTPFHCEVYFINKTEQMAIRWGTDSKVQYLEPTYKFPISIGASGEMSLSVSDSRKLLIKLVGTEAFLGQAKLIQFFRAFLMTRVKTYIAQTMAANAINIFEADSLIKENLHTPDEQKAAGREVAYAVANFSSYLIPNATNNLGTTTESIDKAVDEWLVPICLMNIHVGDSLVKYFGDYEIAEKAYAVVANFTGMEITETGRQVMDLAKSRLAPIREEKAKKDLEEKEAIAAATKRRTEEYWACHEEERKQLEAQMESLLENRKHLNSKVEVLRKEMDNVPSIAVRDEKQKVMGDLKEQLKSLGFFKGKEKKSIQARIDELKHEMEQLTASIESEKAPLQQKISELMGEVRKLDEQVGTITIELTKER